MNEGWICPKCGKALAPWMPSCDCYSKKDGFRITCEETNGPVTIPKHISPNDNNFSSFCVEDFKTF